MLSAVDPAQPYGAALPWPERSGDCRRPARTAGAYVVLSDGEPILYVERGGRGAPDARRRRMTRASSPRLVALVEQVRAGRIKRLALEKIDGEPALGSPLAPCWWRSGSRRDRGG